MKKNINYKTIHFPFCDLATLAFNNIVILNITTDLQNYELNTHCDTLFKMLTKFLAII